MCRDHIAVRIGTRIDVTMTETATSAVAAGASALNFGTISAINIGVATAAPAELEAAIPAVPSPPPMNMSAKISGIPVTIITVIPSTMPSKPVCEITAKFMVLPKAKAKNGTSVCNALQKNSRSSESRFPNVKPIRSGRKVPTKTFGPNEVMPVVPSIIIVIKGPDSNDIRTNAPASSFVPYCCMSDAYRQPLVMSIDATNASVERPVRKPNSTPFSGMKCNANTATPHATAIFVTTNVPDFRNTVPAALSLIDAPMQKNQTARIGTVPEIKPLVKEPKYLPASGTTV